VAADLLKATPTRSASAEHVRNVLARRATDAGEHAQTAPRNRPISPIADTARYDRLRPITIIKESSMRDSERMFKANSRHCG
jgi:hypothetical protein